MKELKEIIKELKIFKDFENEFKQEKLSHAFLIVGKDKIINFNFALCLSGVVCPEIGAKNADITVFNEQTFLTADCEKLIEKSAYKPIVSENKVFIINADGISAIVQNKLLKTIEEPPKNTYFFIVGASLEEFLPTIKSRCAKIVLEKLNFLQFEKLGFNKAQFQKSNGNLEIATKLLSDDSFNEKYKQVLNVLIEVQKSSQVFIFSRKLAKNKDELGEILNIFESIFTELLSCHTKHEKFFDERLFQDFPLKTCANLILTVLDAKKQNKSNCNVGAICDNLLLNILEVKYKCKKGLL